MDAPQTGSVAMPERARKRNGPSRQMTGGAVVTSTRELLRPTSQARLPPTRDQAEGAAKEEGTLDRHERTVQQRTERVKRGDDEKSRPVLNLYRSRRSLAAISIRLYRIAAC